MVFLTGILLGLLLTVVVAYLWHIRKAYDFFVRLNIPGPPPTLFFGNFLEIFKSNGTAFAIKQWTDKYGHIFGYFEGHRPVLVVSDPDVLEDIFVKSFSKFHTKRELPVFDPRAKAVGLSRVDGARWKRQRFILNPTFSSAKLKQMLPLIHRSVEALMKKMADQCGRGESFDIYAYFQRFTMDTIWSCGFGLDTDMQNNINDPFLLNSQKFFQTVNFRGVVSNLIFSITELKHVFRSTIQLLGVIRYSIRRYIPVARWFVAENPITWIMKQAYDLIEKRRQIGQTGRTDLLQLMLASVSDEDFIQDSLTSLEKNEDGEFEVPLIRKITKHEVAGNIFIFMVAGYETTSTALAYATYILATHPEVQQKLHEHIDAHFHPETEHTMPTYEIVSEMDYLDRFIRETLRMFPIAPFAVTRQSTEDFHLKNFGILPADTLICVDMYDLHYNPDLWGPLDPHEFHPERFETKRHPMSWVSFGAGPRTCIGMRFALLEMKTLLVRLLKTYTIINCGEKTTKPFRELEDNGVIAPKNVFIKLQRRDEQPH